VAYQAIQSFSAEFGDGRPAQAVNKGEIFPDGHELVRRDADSSGGRQPWQLFKELDLGEEKPKSAPKAAPRRAASAVPGEAG
jgi:hypothetical protein